MKYVGSNSNNRDIATLEDINAAKAKASDTTPVAVGTASAGTEDEYARGDHSHPDNPNSVLLKKVTGAMPNYAWGKIAYANGYFVAITTDTSHKIAYSQDGLTWELADTSSIDYHIEQNADKPFIGIAASDTYWQIIQQDAEKSYFADVSNPTFWYGATSLFFAVHAISANPDSDLFVLLCDGKALYGNLTGYNFAFNSAITTDLTNLIYDGYRFVAFSNNSTKYIYSTDGATWTSGTIAIGVGLDAVTYGNNYYACLSTSSSVVELGQLLNGEISWNKTISLPKSRTWTDITYGNGLFIVSSSDGNFIYFGTGGSTSTSIIPATDNYTSITYGKGRFVAIGSSVVASIVSTDGANWFSSETALVSPANVDISSDISTVLGIDSLKTEIVNKQDEITGAATSIVSDNLTGNRALVSLPVGKVGVSSVTSTELGYLSGVTSKVQTQLNAKVPTSCTINSKALSSNITLSASDVGAVPTTRTVNGKALSANITLGASDVGAVSTSGGTINGNSLNIVGNSLNVYDANAKDKLTISDTTIRQGTDNNKLDSVQIDLDSATHTITLSAYESESQSGTTATLTGIKGGTADNDAVNVSQLNAVVANIPTIPDNLVKYTQVVDVEATPNINADTLSGHSADYFATATSVSTLDSTVSTLSNSVTTNTNGIAGLSADLQTAQQNITTLQGDLETAQTNINTNNSAIENAQSDIGILKTAKLNLSGGTMTGALVSQTNTNYTTRQVRNVIISTSAPSGGSNGDIWLQYST